MPSWSKRALIPLAQRPGHAHCSIGAVLSRTRRVTASDQHLDAGDLRLLDDDVLEVLVVPRVVRHLVEHLLHRTRSSW